MTPTAGALFDLDGVLIDSEGIYSQFWGEIGRLYRPDMPDFAMRIKGTTLPQILGTYFDDPEVVADICRRLDELEANVKFALFPGVVEFLTALKAMGIPAAIVTSSGADKMERLFAHYPDFPSYFTAIVTAADVTRSKPDPQCFMVGAQKIGVPAERCLVFEDSGHGLAAARACGAKVIGIPTTLPEAEVAASADVVIHTFAGLNPADLF